jgi:potassium uptake TrkH family protein
LPRSIQHPARLVPLAFLAAIAVGTLLLMLPFARSGPGGAPVLTALFTAVSAVCVTGLTIVDTPTYWSGFGQGVILLLFQVGGFGIMSGATLLGLLVTRNSRLGNRLLAQAESRGMALGDVREILKLVFAVTLIVEGVVALLLLLSFRFAHGQTVGDAAWNGLFHAVSAFNNAGFSTYSNNLIGFVADPLVILPILAAIIIGGLGFPAIYEMRRSPRGPLAWSVHTKITVLGTVVLLVGGFVLTLAYEWTNPGTLGPLSIGGKLLAAVTHSTMTRTAGFNSVDVGAMNTETLAVSYVLMLIGGGSAGTAGGIKVTTFFLLGLVVWAEIRGEPDATAFKRRICPNVQRQALTVVLMAVGLVGVGTLMLLSVSTLPLEDLLFEAISAFATVGLSTGVTAKLPPAGLAVLIVLMFIGRVGTIAVATALALQTSRTPYRYPEERPIVG